MTNMAPDLPATPAALGVSELVAPPLLSLAAGVLPEFGPYLEGVGLGGVA